MKKIFQLLLLSLVIINVNAQTYSPPAYADIDNNHRTYVNNVFGALEANRVPTGLLADYSFDLIHHLTIITKPYVAKLWPVTYQK
jgi:hypothetical protein